LGTHSLQGCAYAGSPIRTVDYRSPYGCPGAGLGTARVKATSTAQDNCGNKGKIPVLPVIVVHIHEGKYKKRHLSIKTAYILKGSFF